MSTTLNKEAIQAALVQAGFTRVGDLLTLTRPASEMPYAKEHIISSEGLSEQALATLTVDANNILRFSIAPDYHEEPDDVMSEDALGVLNDAGVKEAFEKALNR